MSTIKSINVQHPSSATINIVNDASGNVAVGGTLTVGGVAAVAVAPSTAGNVLTSNGTVWTSAAPSGGTTPSAIGQIPFSTNGSTYTPTQKIVQGTVNAGGTNPFPSTGGPVVVDFTSIPSWVKRVTVMFNGVSTSGSSIIQIQVGTSSGVDAASYNGYVLTTSVSVGTGGISFANGFYTSNGTGATFTMYGTMVLTLLGSNLWVGSGVLTEPVGARAYQTSGSKTLSGTLDRVRITTVNGTDTFDAGSINIMYE
jgi:hypothetical protein